MSTDLGLKMFIDLSIKLTGFNEAELESTGQTQAYYSIFSKSYPLVAKSSFKDSNAMLLREEIRAAYGLSNLTEAKTLMDATITLWYAGLWNGNYVNEFAYAEGLMWKTFHAHPPGHKQPGYASWSIKPLTAK